MSLSFYDLWRTPVLSGLNYLPPQYTEGAPDTFLHVSYAYSLEEEQQARLSEIFVRNRFCVHPTTNEKFSLAELCSFIEEQLKEKRISLKGAPLLCGMAAKHVLANICYSSIEICYIIADDPAAFKIIHEFMLTLKKMQPSNLNDMLIFHLGHIKIRFFTPKNYALAPDGFYVSLIEDSKAHFKKGSHWVENFEFHHQIQKLKNRELESYDPLNPDLFWDLSHHITQGFTIPGIIQESIEQLKKESHIAQKFTYHQEFHHHLSNSGKIVDFLNQLSLLVNCGDKQLILELSQAWLERGFLVFEFDALKSLVELIRQDTNRAKNILTISQALFLIAWIQDSKKYPAYKFPFSDHKMPRMFIRVIKLVLQGDFHRIDPFNIQKYLSLLFEHAAKGQFNSHREMSNIINVPGFIALFQGTKHLSKHIEIEAYYCSALIKDRKLNLNQLIDRLEYLFNLVKSNQNNEISTLCLALKAAQKTLFLKLFLDKTLLVDLQYFLKLLEKIITTAQADNRITNFVTQNMDESVKYLTYLKGMYKALEKYSKDSFLSGNSKQANIKMLIEKSNNDYLTICEELCGKDFQNVLPVFTGLQILAQFQSDEQFEQFITEYTHIVMDAWMKPLAAFLKTPQTQEILDKFTAKMELPAKK